jgi:hypothetical protein
MKQNYLVTYLCTGRGRTPQYAMVVTDDVVGWLESVQEFPDETYLLINQLPITDVDAALIDDQLKGM